MKCLFSVGRPTRVPLYDADVTRDLPISFGAPEEETN